ncbi:hypothetical protein D3C77_538280 [compost metagenome]
MAVPNGLPLRLMNSQDIPLNSCTPTGMMRVKVTAPMISKVMKEVRIMSRLSGMNRRTCRSTEAPMILAISTPMMLPRGSI